MKQATLFAGFTRPVEDATTDGVAILTRTREGFNNLRTLKMNEAQVTKCVIDFLQIERGWFPLRTPVGRLQREYGGEWLGPVGRPDWIFVNPHYFPSFFWTEMKGTGEKPDPMQVAVMKVLASEGHLVTWTDCPDKFAKWYDEQIQSGRLQPIR